MLQLLLPAGISARDAVRAGYHFNNFVTEFVADEVRLAMAAPRRWARARGVLAETRRQLRALPAAEYPILERLADLVADNDPDGLFQFGLELWIGGLERSVWRRTAGTHRRSPPDTRCVRRRDRRRRRTRRSRSRAIGGDHERRVCLRLERRLDPP